MRAEDFSHLPRIESERKWIAFEVADVTAPPFPAATEDSPYVLVVQEGEPAETYRICSPGLVDEGLACMNYCGTEMWHTSKATRHLKVIPFELIESYGVLRDNRKTGELETLFVPLSYEMTEAVQKTNTRRNNWRW